MKIKSDRLFLALGLWLSMAIIVAGIIGCASEQNVSNLNDSHIYFIPNGSGDDHTQPVYTSPNTTPATNDWPAANTHP